MRKKELINVVAKLSSWMGQIQARLDKAASTSVDMEQGEEYTHPRRIRKELDKLESRVESMEEYFHIAHAPRAYRHVSLKTTTDESKTPTV